MYVLPSMFSTGTSIVVSLPFIVHTGADVLMVIFVSSLFTLIDLFSSFHVTVYPRYSHTPLMGSITLP